MSGDEFETHRAFLMGIAYRMLSSSAEAEDAVQDAWLRYRSADTASILDVRAWLATTIARLCIDRLRSARVRREAYPGVWLPEPVLTTTPLDVGSIELGFLVLLERLNPKERAVFLLNRVFDYSHAEISEMLDITEPTCRQILRRAEKHVEANKPRFEVTREAHQRLLSAFLAAASRGDVAAISSVLAEDVVLYGDNAGRVAGRGPRTGAVLHPIEGRETIARFFAEKVAGLPAMPGFAVEITDVNGWPAVVARSGGDVLFVLNIETDGVQIRAIRSVLAPEKLRLREVN